MVISCYQVVAKDALILQKLIDFGLQVDIYGLQLYVEQILAQNFTWLEDFWKLGIKVYIGISVANVLLKLGLKSSVRPASVSLVAVYNTCHLNHPS